MVGEQVAGLGLNRDYPKTLLQLGDGEVDDVGYDGLIVETDDKNCNCYSHCRKQHAERGLLDSGGLLFYRLMEQATDCSPVPRKMIAGGKTKHMVDG